MGGVFNIVNLHVYHYAGNNPIKYVDPDGEKILDVSTTLFQESDEKEFLGEGTTKINSHGCVLTTYTRIGNALSIFGEFSLKAANEFALKNAFFVGENKNLLTNSGGGPSLVNLLARLSGNKVSLEKSLSDESLNTYAAILAKYEESAGLYAVSIRLSSGHTVNMNSDGLIKDENGNYTIKLNNTSSKGYLPEGVKDGIVVDSKAIVRIDIFRIDKKPIAVLPD